MSNGDNSGKNSGNIGNEDIDNSAGRGNGLPCWYHENRMCKFRQNCRKIHKLICETQ